MRHRICGLLVLLFGALVQKRFFIFLCEYVGSTCSTDARAGPAGLWRRGSTHRAMEPQHLGWSPLPGPTPNPQWRGPGSKSSFISEKSPCDSRGCFLAPNRQFHPLCPSQSVPDSWWVGLDKCGTSPSAHRHFFPVIPIETGGICIAPRPSEEGAEILPAMAMRPFFGIMPVLMDDKVCKGLPSSTHTPLSSLVFLPAFLASVAHSPTSHVPRAWQVVGGACVLSSMHCRLLVDRVDAVTTRGRSPLQEGSSQSKRLWTAPSGHTCYFSASSQAANFSSLLLKHNLSLFSNACLPGLQGNVLEGNKVSGALCLSQAWPGLARTIYGNHQRFLETYFNIYPGERDAFPHLPGALFSEHVPKGTVPVSVPHAGSEQVL